MNKDNTKYWEKGCSFSSNFVIRKMIKNDLDKVMVIENKSFYYPWARSSFENELLFNDMAEYFVVCQNNNKGLIVAYAGMWIVKDNAHLTTLAVAEAYRQQGLGSLFIKHLKSWARFHGAIRMTLEVRPSNLKALRLYRKHGFEITKIHTQYYYDEDALVMTSTLLDSSIYLGKHRYNT